MELCLRNAKFRKPGGYFEFAYKYYFGEYSAW